MESTQLVEAYELLIADIKRQHSQEIREQEDHFAAACDAMDFIDRSDLMDDFVVWIIKTEKQQKFLRFITENYELSDSSEALINKMHKV